MIMICAMLKGARQQGGYVVVERRAEAQPRGVTQPVDWALGVVTPCPSSSRLLDGGR